MTKLTVEEAANLGIHEADRALTLAPGARLIECRWSYDEANDSGGYEFSDVTESAIFRLFAPTAMGKDTRLRDVFVFVRNNSALQPLLNNWCEEYIAEGLDKPAKPWTGEPDPDEIEYLELYRLTEANTLDKSKPPLLESLDFLQFHGLGFQSAPGERTAWGLMHSPANELVDIPLRINDSFVIYDDESFQPLATYTAPLPRLIDILHAIFWELSFQGSPSDRDRRREELEETVRAVERGEIETYPWPET